MSCVRTGAQHGGEPSAGGGAYGPENRRRRCVSAGSEGQDSPAREIETRNVQRQTARMRTCLAGDFAVTISTFEARPRSDCLQGEGEILGEDGRDHSTEPLGHRFGQAAVDQRTGGEFDGCARPMAEDQTLEPDRHRNEASLGNIWRRLRAELDSQTGQPRQACSDIGRADIGSLPVAGKRPRLKLRGPLWRQRLGTDF
jgi:hypothetical protein